MTDELILVSQPVPYVTQISFNKPEKRNALCIAMMEQICEAIDKTEQDKSQRVILFKGEGKSFCAGLDMEEATNQELSHLSAEHMAKLLNKISNCGQVTIAVVHGAAVAGGAGVMSACDLAIAAKGTRFGYPEVRRGLVPGLVMTFLLRQLSLKHVYELLLLGELINAERAQSIGLINKVVREEELLSEALRMAAFAAEGAPGAIAHTKRMMDVLHGPSVSEALQKAFSHHMEARTSAEAIEGIQAFVDKRKPIW
jgi:methylglutaconyl-CoA hydratase